MREGIEKQKKTERETIKKLVEWQVSGFPDMLGKWPRRY